MVLRIPRPSFAEELHRFMYETCLKNQVKISLNLKTLVDLLPLKYDIRVSELWLWYQFLKKTNSRSLPHVHHSSCALVS